MVQGWIDTLGFFFFLLGLWVETVLFLPSRVGLLMCRMILDYCPVLIVFKAARLGIRIPWWLR